MPSYVLLNSGNHVGLNAGGAVLLNIEDSEVVSQGNNYTYGLGPMGKVRIHPHPLFNRTKQ